MIWLHRVAMVAWVSMTVFAFCASIYIDSMSRFDRGAAAWLLFVCGAQVMQAAINHEHERKRPEEQR